MKRKLEILKPFMLGVIFTVLIAGGFHNISEAKEQTPVISSVKYAININGDPIDLVETLNVDGKTYVQLREFCESAKMEIIWNDPNLQRMPIPYGNYHNGITILNPSVISSKIMKHSLTSQEGEYINISGILERYSDKNEYLPYSFSCNGGQDSLIIKINGKQTQIPLKTFPSNQQTYISIDDFKADILPYWVDMCLENENFLLN